MCGGLRLQCDSADVRTVRPIVEKETRPKCFFWDNREALTFLNKTVARKERSGGFANAKEVKPLPSQEHNI